MAFVFDAAYRDQIGRSLTVQLGTSIQAGDVPDEELAEICNFILVALDSINIQDDLVHFLSTLAKRWTFFSDICTQELKKLNASQSIESMFQRSTT